jgi:hypothetical protein
MALGECAEHIESDRAQQRLRSQNAMPSCMIGSDARRLVDRWPDRFGFFATLPLPDVDAAVVEASRVLDDLGADGVAVLTNHGASTADQHLRTRFRAVYLSTAELAAC